MTGRLHSSLKRLLMPLVILLVAFIQPVYAQDVRELVPGASITGVLDMDNVAQVFVFEAVADAIVTVTAESTSGLGLAVLLTDAEGQTVAQHYETNQPTTLADVSLPQADTYYVTVLSALGVALPSGSTFELTFDMQGGTAQPGTGTPADATPLPTVPVTVAPTTTPEPTQAPDMFEPGQVLSMTGMEIRLTWQSLANLDLEVRDPVGGSVYFARESTDSGGQFDANVNSVCDTRTEDALERATWPSGALPTGSYELLIYYQPLDACPTQDPVNFTVSVVLDGEVVEVINGTFQPLETYVGGFRINADGGISVGPSGLYNEPGVLTIPFVELQADAEPIAFDVPINGVITSGDYFDTFTFEGQANELISAQVNATDGSLDTVLLLLDSSGAIVTLSDDIVSGVETDSFIENYRLLTSGTYMLVVTRYGKEVGGTEGPYTLSLTGPTGDLPSEVIDLGLPRGDLEIALTWNTTADIQLLVRDPRTESLYDDTPQLQVSSGGRLAATGNINCTPAQTSPVSYAYWPEGMLTAGVYEIEVWYQNTCGDNSPVTFALNVLVDGKPVITQTAQPAAGDVYVTSFVVGVDRQVQAGDGGFIGQRPQGGVQRLDSSILDIQGQLPSALPITSGQPVSGTITNQLNDKFDLYTFEGQAGDVVTISMMATTGGLDTLVFLLDGNGLQLADNDDAASGETDSLIQEYVLPQDGQYIIVATHFGMIYGGTTGAYNLTFSRLN